MSENDRLRLQINGKDFGELKSYSLHKDILQGCGRFQADINPLRMVSVCHEPLFYSVTVGDKLVQRGWIDETQRKVTKDSHSFTITGRDTVQVWVDNYVLKTRAFSGMSLEDVVKTTISENSSVSVGGRTLKLSSAIEPTITPQAKEQAKSLIASIKCVTSHPGQTIWDFLSGICNQLGLVIFADADGNITIDTLLRESDGSPKFSAYNLREDKGSNNVKEVEYRENATAYHAYRKIQGQASGLNLDNNDSEQLTFSNRKTDSQHRMEHYDSSFLGLMRFRSATLMDTDTAAWSGSSAEKLTRNLGMTEARDLFRLSLTMRGHAQSDPYDINQAIWVDDEITGIRGRWMIYGVEMKGSKSDGSTTTLECHTISTTSANEDTLPFQSLYDTIKAKDYWTREGATL
jgi:prophage tail gpP-like protein